MKTKTPLINIMLGLLTMVIVFHCLIIAKIIPYEITWGGRLKNDTEMYIFETFSIFLNLFLIWILLMKAGYVRFRFYEKVVNSLLYFYLLLFIVNTIGNIFAKTMLEKIFTILTLFFAILIFSILKMKNISGLEKP